MDQERSELEKLNNDAETSEEAEQIKREIVRTRAEMSETIDAIEDKFDVSRITEQVKDEVTEHISDAYETAKDSVYQATIGKAGEIMKTVGKEAGKMTEAVGDAGSYVVRGVKHNPLPLALIGLGIGLLIFQGSGSSKSRRKSVGNSTANRTKGLIGGAAGSVGNAANSVYDKAGNLVSQTGEQLSHAGQYARDLSHDAYEYYEEVYDSNPLVVGAVALGIGAAIALAIPSTRYENELMGDAKQNLISSAGDLAQNAISKAKETVGEAAETARKQAAG